MYIKFNIVSFIYQYLYFHIHYINKLYSSWLIDHVSKTDRELSALLIGKAPESELELENDAPIDILYVPDSYTHFLDSDNASL